MTMSDLRAFVGVYPVNARGEVLLQLRDDRPDLDGANTWSTLGGLIEPGETPEEAAHRELAEECGRTPGPLVPVRVREWVQPGADVARRFHSFATPAAWSLDELVLGEGQAMAWIPAGDLSRMSLNPLIAGDMLDFAQSALVRDIAAVAPQPHEPSLSALPAGLITAVGIRPGDLVAVHGVTAGFAARLRAALPPGARLTASPGGHERPNIALWRLHSPGDLSQIRTIAETLAPGGSLAVVTPPAITGEDRSALRATAAAAGLTEDGAFTAGDGAEEVHFIRYASP
jgi:8-oxo-dGTP diphosphatase